MHASSHELSTSVDGADDGASDSGRSSPVPVPPLPPTGGGALSRGPLPSHSTHEHHVAFPLDTKDEHVAAVKGAKKLMKQGSVVMDWVTQFDDDAIHSGPIESEATSQNHAKSRCDIFLVRHDSRGLSLLQAPP